MKDKKREKASDQPGTAVPPKRQDNWRETIESIVVAFVLAFLFRTFEAEAFVIPTGSMAPTLYGQHRDVYCSQCGTRFAVGVSSLPSSDAEIRDGMLVPGYRSNFAVCPNANCRFPNDVLVQEMFAGDRILVNKFPYEFGEPQRWDVVVFKFPEQARTNYIKRLVGLPGEQVRLEWGDVKVRRIDSADPTFRIARKAPDKQRALQLLVHENDHPARELLKAGWPESWEGVNTAAWKLDDATRSFEVDAGAGGEGWDWLRYTHYLPSAADWTDALAGQPLSMPPAELIRDFYAYNARITVDNAANAVSSGKLPDLPPDPMTPEQWVGDLTLTCTVELLAAGGQLNFELVEGLRRHYCRIDLSSGQGEFALIHEDDARNLENPEAKEIGGPFETGMNRPGRYTICFANVDDRLCFWVDNRLVKSLEFDEGSKFEPQPGPIRPTERDRSPVAIGARGAKLRVSHLKIERDTYYLNEPPGNQSADRTFDLLDDPNDSRDEFLMLGDNSPRSNDSRMWQSTHSVPRHLLIGKAFFVYWPHAVPFLNDGRGFPLAKYYEAPHRGPANPPIPKFSVPFYPQVQRMHRIR